LKAIAFKISDQLADRLAETYGNRNRGAQRAVESWNVLQILTLMEIKNIFTEKELNFLLRYAENKDFLSINAASNEIFPKEVSQYYNLYSDPNIINFSELISKIHKLTTAQMLFFNDWLDRYWTVNKGKIDENEYVKFLSKEKE
jgi:hypothetical protein